MVLLQNGKRILVLFSFLLVCNFSKGQFLMDMIDTTSDVNKSILSVTSRFDNIRMSGYIQPQFQLAGSKGAKSYNGGDFQPNVNNRFMLRRGRLRFEYVHLNRNNIPSIQFLFQIDGTERGVVTRDFWGRVLENKMKMFGFVIGIFARPFSYEVNLGSSDRESPERGRMSQILMRSERDLGAMISFEPRIKDHPLRYLKFDAGLFNGQGVNAAADFDSHKDFITRLSLKPVPVTKKVSVSGGLSWLNGGLLQNTKYVYKLDPSSKAFKIDSSLGNIGKISPRKYYGGDVQVKIKNRVGSTELRAEYMKGTQTGLAHTTETPIALPVDMNNPYFVRKFDGAYFYLLQHLFSLKHQAVLKFDWYDPETRLNGMDIGKAGANVDEANIKHSTLGFGYIHYISNNLKLVLWYDQVVNEKTQLPAFVDDVKDDVFTFRMHFRF